MLEQQLSATLRNSNAALHRDAAELDPSDFKSVVEMLGEITDWVEAAAGELRGGMYEAAKRIRNALNAVQHSFADYCSEAQNLPPGFAALVTEMQKFRVSVGMHAGTSDSSMARSILQQFKLHWTAEGNPAEAVIDEGMKMPENFRPVEVICGVGPYKPSQKD